MLSWLLFLLCFTPGVLSRRFHYGEAVREWPAMCEGHNQSPVQIWSTKAIPLAIPALEMVGFHNLLPRSVILTNSGHSVELKWSEQYGRLFGALLDGEYEVLGLHFHWGRSNNKGSEHHVNGVRFPIEMHVVSRNMKYNSTEEALKHPNGLAVLAFFYHLREKGSSSLQPILRELELLQPDGSTGYLTHSFPLSSLLPRDTDLFYTYRGSLTTPPCSEAVTWLVFPDPMPISYVQLNKFRSLSDGIKQMGDNFRNLVHLGSRKVYVRRAASDSSRYRNIYRNIASPDFWGTRRNTEHAELLPHTSPGPQDEMELEA